MTLLCKAAVSHYEIIYETDHLRFIISARHAFWRRWTIGLYVQGFAALTFLMSHSIDGAHKGKYSFDAFVHHRPSYSSPRWLANPPIDDVSCR